MWLRRIIVEQLSMRLFDWVRGMTVRQEYERLKELDGAGREQILEVQRDKLKRLLEHAYENVPFYRRRFEEAGVTPADIRGPEDLALLPPLTRQDMQSSGHEMVARGYDVAGGYTGCSSGSTGQPVKYSRDRRGSSVNQAAMFWGWGFSGWQPGMRMLNIWGNLTTVQQQWSRLSSRIKSRLFFESRFPACDLVDSDGFRRLYDQYMELRPDCIHGYTNAIYSFCCYLKRNDLQVPRVGIVLTTAENLQEHQRSMIESVLGTVYDFYGCGEINSVAFQCSHGEYHLIDPHVVVETGNITDSEGNSEFYLTDLDNYGMPLIRYANGDMGRVRVNNDCPCGLPLGVMESISGRMSDVFQTPDGGVLSVPSFLGNGLLKKVPAIERYQVVIEEDTKLLVKLVAPRGISEADEEMLRQTLDEYVPGTVDCRYEFVDEIGPEVTGKYKLLVDKRLKA